MTKLISETVTIVNMRGLHARAAAKLVKCAGDYRADVEVVLGDVRVVATSIMGLMMLAAKKGTKIEIAAQGDDAQMAVEAIKKLITDRFEEDE